MKKLKKYLGFVMAALMAFALTPMSAFADEETPAEPETGTITVENAVKGQEYYLYKILELESYNTEKNAYSYKVVDGWQGFLATQRFEIDNQGYVNWATAPKDDSAEIAAFADAAIEFAKANGIDPVVSQTAAGAKVEFKDLPLGYYLLDSTLGTVCSLDTNAPNVTIKEKNPEPTVDKAVEEGGEYGDVSYAGIGDPVKFQGTISVNKKGASKIVYHDKMSAGLSFDRTSVSVTKNGEAVSEDNYTIVDGEDITDGCTFEVAFDEFFCNDLVETDVLVISYSAILNANAVVGIDGNTNEAKLVYGENGGSETEWDKTTTYTWEVNVFKFTGNDQGLADAVFELTKADGTPVNVVPVEGNANTYRVGASTTNSITTADGGKFKIEGLDAGTYKLTETAAPAGYNKLADPVEFTIGPDGSVTGTTDVEGVPTIKVENNTGLELPSTGGIGTTLFYVGGAILIIGCVAFLITRRRAGSAK